MKTLSLIALIALASCASSGTKIDSSAVSRLQEGVTTQHQVLEQFGQPTDTMRLPDGNTFFTYSYSAMQVHPETFIPIVGAFVGGADSEHTMIIMVFGKDGVLRSYTDQRGASGSGSNFEGVSQSRKDTGEIK